ncbi:MAG: tRNA pseudouridine(55) synthase TruB [Endomicrobium sp.]|uniref:tRNA pseudouridine(55) synthase TruB n=1 Tax=Candidatus Endomicrobiellum cubanum TaxID=3242325 RepID=UPI002832CE5F|nr:tRNA pseudouridine(55) synthase TruB [Endomicrobium sp.]
MSRCNNISGMLLVDKPSNITSFKVVKILRKLLNVKKAGHCGTLDPLASGLLLILFGKATKLQDKFMKKDKVYTSSFLLGTVTDTYDFDGKIVSVKEVSNISIEKIKNLLNNFKGDIYQTPPMYSALKVNGQKLYTLARKGIEVSRNSRKVIIREFDVLSFDKNIVNVKIHCSSGTYVRCLAKDLGDVLGCGATVKTLRREKIHNFDVKDALPFENSNDLDKIMSNIISYETLIGFLDRQP